MAAPHPTPCPGYYQACNKQGHTAQYCPAISLKLSTTTSILSPFSPAPWQHHVNYSATTKPNTSSWLLGSEENHHVTSNLSNLSTHTHYNGSADVVIRDDTSLPKIHTSSTYLSTPSHTFSLNNVLCAPTVQKNLISISQFCQSNNNSIEFLPFSFRVKNLSTGAIVLHDRTKNGVYEWPVSSNKSSPLIAFSSAKTSSSEWHHRLGHLFSSILKHIISSFHLESSSPLSPDFNCNSC